MLTITATLMTISSDQLLTVAHFDPHERGLRHQYQ
jgi:hypothetical protein